MDNINTEIIRTNETSSNLIDILAKGGILMVPLAILFGMSIYIFINRLLIINKCIANSEKLTTDAINYLKINQVEEIIKQCKKYNSLISKVIYKIISNIGKPINQIYIFSENTARIEISKIEKNISSLSLMAAIAPMIGFVGTVIGVIQIFFNIAQAGEININIVAGGLYVKLITSATGLIVGIIAYIFYYILDNKLDTLSIQIEEKSTQIIEVLDNPY